MSKIDEIMFVMEQIEYGFKDENGKNIIIYDKKRWENDFESFYFLQTPEELLESKCGVCWDQVELERKMFRGSNIKFKSYFVYILDGENLPSHTFLVFENNDKYYWFEHSWAKYKGIFEYNCLEELLKDVVSKFRNNHEEISEDAKLYLYEYDEPKKHILCNDFYKYIETQKLIKLD